MICYCLCSKSFLLKQSLLNGRQKTCLTELQDYPFPLIILLLNKAAMRPWVAHLGSSLFQAILEEDKILIITKSFVILIFSFKSFFMLLKRYMVLREEKKVTGRWKKIAARRKLLSLWWFFAHLNTFNSHYIKKFYDSLTTYQPWAKADNYTWT